MMPDKIYATIKWNNIYSPPMPELTLLQTSVDNDKFPFCWVVLPPGMSWYGEAKITTEARYMRTVGEIFSIVRYEIEKMIPNDEVPAWELLLHGLSAIPVLFIEKVDPNMYYIDELKWRSLNLDEVFEFVQSGMKKMGFSSW